jgi:hypothetical protein
MREGVGWGGVGTLPPERGGGAEATHGQED